MSSTTRQPARRWRRSQRTLSFPAARPGRSATPNSFGDPVVVYDQLANRWILTNFAFISFPGPGPFYQCFAVSQTSDPVAGGWFLYAVRIDQGAVPAGTLPDYGKFGHWNDGCLYMGANAFDINGAFSGNIFASFSKNDMENGLPLTARWASPISVLLCFPRIFSGRNQGKCRHPARRTISFATPLQPLIKCGHLLRARIVALAAQ